MASRRSFSVEPEDLAVSSPRRSSRIAKTIHVDSPVPAGKKAESLSEIPVRRTRRSQSIQEKSLSNIQEDLKSKPDSVGSSVMSKNKAETKIPLRRGRRSISVQDDSQLQSTDEKETKSKSRKSISKENSVDIAEDDEKPTEIIISDDEEKVGRPKRRVTRSMSRSPVNTQSTNPAPSAIKKQPLKRRSSLNEKLQNESKINALDIIKENEDEHDKSQKIASVETDLINNNSKKQQEKLALEQSTSSTKISPTKNTFLKEKEVQDKVAELKKVTPDEDTKELADTLNKSKTGVIENYDKNKTESIILSCSSKSPKTESVLKEDKEKDIRLQLNTKTIFAEETNGKDNEGIQANKKDNIKLDITEKNSEKLEIMNESSKLNVTEDITENLNISASTEKNSKQNKSIVVEDITKELEITTNSEINQSNCSVKGKFNETGDTSESKQISIMNQINDSDMSEKLEISITEMNKSNHSKKSNKSYVAEEISEALECSININKSEELNKTNEKIDKALDIVDNELHKLEMEEIHDKDTSKISTKNIEEETGSNISIVGDESTNVSSTPARTETSKIHFNEELEHNLSLVNVDGKSYSPIINVIQNISVHFDKSTDVIIDPTGKDKFLSKSLDSSRKDDEHKVIDDSTNSVETSPGLPDMSEKYVKSTPSKKSDIIEVKTPSSNNKSISKKATPNEKRDQLLDDYIATFTSEKKRKRDLEETQSETTLPDQKKKRKHIPEIDFSDSEDERDEIPERKARYRGDSESESQSEEECRNEFIDDMAFEGSEDTPSIDSNDIIEEGESLGSSDSENDLDSDDSYGHGSFVVDDDDVNEELLSGNEDFLKESDLPKKRKRIIIDTDSEDDLDKMSVKPYGGLSPSDASENQISLIETDLETVKTKNEKLSLLIEKGNTPNYNSDESDIMIIEEDKNSSDVEEDKNKSDLVEDKNKSVIEEDAVNDLQKEPIKETDENEKAPIIETEINYDEKPSIIETEINDDSDSKILSSSEEITLSEEKETDVSQNIEEIVENVPEESVQITETTSRTEISLDTTFTLEDSDSENINKDEKEVKYIELVEKYFKKLNTDKSKKRTRRESIGETNKADEMSETKNKRKRRQSLGIDMNESFRKEARDLFENYCKKLMKENKSKRLSISNKQNETEEFSFRQEVETIEINNSQVNNSESTYEFNTSGVIIVSPMPTQKDSLSNLTAEDSEAIEEMKMLEDFNNSLNEDIETSYSEETISRKKINKKLSTPQKTETTDTNFECTEEKTSSKKLKKKLATPNRNEKSFDANSSNVEKSITPKKLKKKLNISQRLDTEQINDDDLIISKEEISPKLLKKKINTPQRNEITNVDSEEETVSPKKMKKKINTPQRNELPNVDSEEETVSPEKLKKKLNTPQRNELRNVANEEETVSPKKLKKKLNTPQRNELSNVASEEETVSPKKLKKKLNTPERNELSNVDREEETVAPKKLKKKLNTPQKRTEIVITSEIEAVSPKKLNTPQRNETATILSTNLASETLSGKKLKKKMNTPQRNEIETAINTSLVNEQETISPKKMKKKLNTSQKTFDEIIAASETLLPSKKIKKNSNTPQKNEIEERITPKKIKNNLSPSLRNAENSDEIISPKKRKLSTPQKPVLTEKVKTSPLSSEDTENYSSVEVKKRKKKNKKVNLETKLHKSSFDSLTDLTSSTNTDHSGPDQNSHKKKSKNKKKQLKLASSDTEESISGTEKSNISSILKINNDFNINTSNKSKKTKKNTNISPINNENTSNNFNFVVKKGKAAPTRGEYDSNEKYIPRNYNMYKNLIKPSADGYTTNNHFFVKEVGNLNKFSHGIKKHKQNIQKINCNFIKASVKGSINCTNLKEKLFSEDIVKNVTTLTRMQKIRKFK